MSTAERSSKGTRSSFVTMSIMKGIFLLSRRSSIKARSLSLRAEVAVTVIIAPSLLSSTSPMTCVRPLSRSPAPGVSMISRLFSPSQGTSTPSRTVFSAASPPLSAVRPSQASCEHSRISERLPFLS